MILGDNMEEIVFQNQEELYKRILPALRTKKRRIRKDGFSTIQEIDIWDYMRYVKWANSYGLELCDMVDDILHVPNQQIVQYCYHKYMPKNTIVEEAYELPKLKKQ